MADVPDEVQRWAAKCKAAGLKAVYRILKAKRWFVHQRSVAPRPRVQGRRRIPPSPMPARPWI